MGSGGFAAEILKKLASSKFKPMAVITQPDKPVGRSQALSLSPAKKIAGDFGLEIREPKSLKSTEAEQMIKSFEPDLIVVVDYGKIIPKNILDIPKFGALNVHPSLLPRHRGATPIQSTIFEGDEKTGVTIILMDEQVDHGPIVAVSDFESPITDLTRRELSKKLAELGSDLLLKMLPQWLAGEIKPAAQDESKATYTKILTKEDGKIDWKKSVAEIERQIRAFEGWPGTWTIWPKGKQNLKIKILKVEDSGDSGVKEPGRVFATPDKEMSVASGAGAVKIQELQLEGKNKTTGREFLRGYPEIVGAILI
jgi:methionyl-tRNA formyltransferase